VTTTIAPEQVTLPVERDGDVVNVRQKGRELAAKVGIRSSDQTLIATAISEIARNIVVYAERGEVTLSTVFHGDRRGILIVAQDQGPGIADIEEALRDGFSTGRSLGLGLPGAKRLMDTFDVVSEVGVGTTITMSKWAR
jgi:serine/threonine-protein kinase RsbT